MEKPEVVNSLATNLANTIVLRFKAQGHHWNVEGPDFSEFHSFFAGIYEDADSAVDTLAEYIRVLGAQAPSSLQDFLELSQIEHHDCGTDALRMVEDLLGATNAIINSYDNLFAIATAFNEQGMANFAAERLDAHKKYRWQLRSFLGGQVVEAPVAIEEPVVVEDIIEAEDY